LDAPAPPSMLALFTQGTGSADLISPQKCRDVESEGSTRSASSSRSSDSCKEEHPAVSLADATLKALESCLIGKWESESGELYQISACTDMSWSCARKSTGGNQKKTSKVRLYYDSQSDTVCWGPAWALFLDASDLRKKPDNIAWFSGKDLSKSKPRFSWQKVCDLKSNVPSSCGLKEEQPDTSPNTGTSSTRTRKRVSRR